MNAWDESSGQVRNFAESQKLPYTILLGGGKTFRESYHGRAIPHTYVIDQNGRITDAHVGWDDGKLRKIEREIKELLQP